VHATFEPALQGGRDIELGGVFRPLEAALWADGRITCSADLGRRALRRSVTQTLHGPVVGIGLYF
jgi:hypothetical protein